MSEDDGAIIEADFHPRLLPPQVQIRRSGKQRANLRAPLPEWVEETAFVCWVEANRQAPQAMRLYAMQQEARLDDEEPLPALAITTMRSWIKRHDWHAKADQLIAANFPGLRMRQVARLVYAGGAALDALIDAVTGEMPGVRPPERIKAAEILLVAGGLGTHGSKERLAPVVKSVSNESVDLEALTEQELGRLAMDALRRTRDTHPERRRH